MNGRSALIRRATEPHETRRVPTDTAGTGGFDNMERGLEIFLNCEINPRDPAGVTMPYRILVPTLSFDGEFEPWVPLEEKKPASSSLSSSWWARISRRARKHKGEEHPSKSSSSAGAVIHDGSADDAGCAHDRMLDETDRGSGDELSDEGDDDSDTAHGGTEGGSGSTKTDTGDSDSNNSGRGKKKFLGLISLSKG